MGLLWCEIAFRYVLLCNLSIAENLHSSQSTPLFSQWIWLNLISGSCHTGASKYVHHMTLYIGIYISIPLQNCSCNYASPYIEEEKLTNPGWAKLPECNRGEASSFVFHAVSVRECAAIPYRLTGQIMLRYQPQPRKRITCVQIELSVWKLKMLSFPWVG